MPLVPASNVLEVEEVPLEAINADPPTSERSHPALAGNRSEPPIHIFPGIAKGESESASNGRPDLKVHQDENGDNDMGSEAPSQEDTSDDDTPRFKETSESEPSSPSSSESEYSEGFRAPLHGIARRRTSSVSREAASSTRCSTSDESLSILATVPGMGAAGVLPRSPHLSRAVPTSNVTNNGASLSIKLADIGPDTGRFHASPNSHSSPQKRRGTMSLDSLEQLSSHCSSPRRPSLALTLPQTPESLIRHSSLSAGGSTPRSLFRASPQEENVRRSRRESKQTDAFTPSSFSPPRKRARRSKEPERMNSSRVYWEETADDGDDWGAYGEMARKDDGKEVVWKPFNEHFSGPQEGEPMNESLEHSSADINNIMLPRVYEVEEASESDPSHSQQQPLSVWCKDATRRFRILNAKGQRTHDNIETLSNWLSNLPSQNTPRYDVMEDSGGIVQERADSLIMDNLEDFMQLKVPAFVWSDNDACQQVLEECRTLADRLKHDNDKHVETWSLKHFSLSKPPASLSPTEIELAWLAEESLYCLQCHSWDWSFIWLHASPELKSVLAQDAPTLVRPAVSQEFRYWRGLIEKALDGGYRRPHMREIVQRHLYLLYLRNKNDDDQD